MSTARRAALLLCVCFAHAAFAAAEKPVVAVLYFDNDTNKKEYDVLQKGVADMMVTDLVGSDQVTVVEREKLQGVVDELKLQRSKFFDPKTAQKLGKLVGAKYAVTGSFVAIDPSLRIDIRMIEVATANVVLTEKVMGKQDEFLELQQSLVQKFLAALKLKTSGPTGGKADVATVLKYSQSVDLSDKGDFEGAKKQLASIVADAPEFEAAQQKYAAVLKRLREASAKRTNVLDATEAQLEKKAREVVAGGVGSIKKGDWKDQSRYLGYRSVLGRIQIARLARLAGPANAAYVLAWVPPTKRADVAALQKAFIAETEALLIDMAEMKMEKGAFPRVPQEEREPVEALAKTGVVWGDYWPDFSSGKVKFDLAVFMLLGDSPFTPHPKIRPSPYVSDPTVLKRALALFAQARKEIVAEHKDKPQELEDLLATMTDQQSDALFAVGKKDDAIAQLQLFLDAYPQARKFKDFEKKIEASLGVSQDAREFLAAISACKLEAAYKAQVLTDLGRADGVAGLRKIHETLMKACNAAEKQTRLTVLPSIEMQISMQASALGDCTLWKESKAVLEKESPAMTSALNTMAPYCASLP